MTYLTIERAAFDAWPALEERQLPYGVLRYADGYTKRANSLVLFNIGQTPYGLLAEQCEEFFGARYRPAIVRIPSFAAMSGLDDYLRYRGYSILAPTLVMSCPLGEAHAGLMPDLTISRDSWLEAYHHIGDEAPEQHAIHSRLIRKIRGQVVFGLLKDTEGNPACCALAVFIGQAVGIFNVATAPVYRRRQFATRLIRALLAWARCCRASHAYLQVEEANQGAVALYHKLGFQILYRYWYRSRETVACGFEQEG